MYHPIERDENPQEIPVIVKKRPPPPVIKAPIKVPLPPPPVKIPIKEYPYCGPGISVKLEPIIKRGKPVHEVIEVPITPVKARVCVRCTINFPDHDGIICTPCIRCRICDINPPHPDLDGIC